jgi:predicted unusual protein kinase regulating ubiquinone biosynthesis (AarF/ABC1/UbiB family)
MDPDLFPPELRLVLSRLQNQAPPMGYGTVARVVEEELGAPPERRFATFEQTPMAAASLGQVHRATLADGRQVVVKVQYPGIDRGLSSDLDNLGGVVKALSLTGKALDGTTYFRELREQLLHELDYVREASLVQSFGEAVAGLPELVVPQVILDHSAKRVLTLELLEGPTLQQWQQGGPSAEERMRVSRQLILATFAPFLRSGRVHGDPHPGNYLVLPDGRLGVLDFGSVRTFEPGFVAVNRRLLAELLGGTPLDLIDLSREAGFTIDLPEAEARSFLEDVAAIATGPIKQSPYDFARDTMARDMREYFAKNPARALKVRPPAESIFFYRACGGLAQNLKSIGASGDFRGVLQSLL